MSIRETFSNSIFLAAIDENEKVTVIHISTELGHVYHVASRKGPLKQGFLDIFRTAFLQSTISEIQKL